VVADETAPLVALLESRSLVDSGLDGVETLIGLVRHNYEESRPGHVPSFARSRD